LSSIYLDWQEAKQLKLHMRSLLEALDASKVMECLIYERSGKRMVLVQSLVALNDSADECEQVGIAILCELNCAAKHVVQDGQEG
tara:strand:- start:507 stop:761 length:255 start_codon:yes stop_codon:yes gene_type:complete